MHQFADSAATTKDQKRHAKTEANFAIPTENL
jgi:hypothetical protein